MLSVFITPWTKPTSIHCATSAAWAATTDSNSARWGCSASAAAGWWRAIAWSARRRSRSRSSVARAYWKVPTRRWLLATRASTAPGQHGLALHGATGRHDGEAAGGGDAEGVHRLADDVLAQHRADRGEAVAAAGERRTSGALEVQVAQPAGVVDELAEQQGAAVAEPRGVAAELVAGVGLGDRRRALGEAGAGQQPDAVAAEPVRVEAELGGQRLVEGEHPGLRGLGGLPGQGQLGQLAGEAAVEDEGGCRGHSLDDTRRAGTIRPPVGRHRQAPPAGSASSMMSGLSRAVTWARHWSTNRARRVPSLRSRTSTPRLPARAAAPSASVRRATW